MPWAKTYIVLPALFNITVQMIAAMATQKQKFSSFVLFTVGLVLTTDITFSDKSFLVEGKV